MRNQIRYNSKMSMGVQTMTLKIKLFCKMRPSLRLLKAQSRKGLKKNMEGEQGAIC